MSSKLGIVAGHLPYFASIYYPLKSFQGPNFSIFPPVQATWAVQVCINLSSNQTAYFFKYASTFRSIGLTPQGVTRTLTVVEGGQPDVSTASFISDNGPGETVITWNKSRPRRALNPTSNPFTGEITAVISCRVLNQTNLCSVLGRPWSKDGEMRCFIKHIVCMYILIRKRKNILQIEISNIELNLKYRIYLEQCTCRDKHFHSKHQILRQCSKSPLYRSNGIQSFDSVIILATPSAKS